MTAGVATMTCGLCGRTFGEDRHQAACQQCPLSTGCKFVRCPHCGYDNPVEPGWIRRFKAWWSER